ARARRSTSTAAPDRQASRFCMASPRRVGSETSKTRDSLLDCVERLMVDTGYPGVTYRAMAAMAEVTPGLVQYYLPTLDLIFVAAIRRGAPRNLKRLV